MSFSRVRVIPQTTLIRTLLCALLLLCSCGIAHGQTEQSDTPPTHAISHIPPPTFVYTLSLLNFYNYEIGLGVAIDEQVLLLTSFIGLGLVAGDTDFGAGVGLSYWYRNINLAAAYSYQRLSVFPYAIVGETGLRSRQLFHTAFDSDTLIFVNYFFYGRLSFDSQTVDHGLYNAFFILWEKVISANTIIGAEGTVALLAIPTTGQIALGGGLSIPLQFVGGAILVTPYLQLVHLFEPTPTSLASDINARADSYITAFSFSPLQQPLQPIESDFLSGVQFEYRWFFLERLPQPVARNIYLGPFAEVGFYFPSILNTNTLTINGAAGIQFGFEIYQFLGAIKLGIDRINGIFFGIDVNASL